MKSKMQMTAGLALLLTMALLPTSAKATSSIMCDSAQGTVKKYLDFKKTTDRFYNTYGTLEKTARNNLLKNGVSNILGLMGDFAMYTSDEKMQQGSLYVQSAQLLDDLKDRNITASAAEQPLKQGLLNLQDSMDDAISRAQAAHPDCNLRYSLAKAGTASKTKSASLNTSQ